MAVEPEHGISVSSVVMSFKHEGLAFNPLDRDGARTRLALYWSGRDLVWSSQRSKGDYNQSGILAADSLQIAQLVIL
jgi:hypothetical protein